MISILFLKEAIIWETKNVFSFFFFFFTFSKFRFNFEYFGEKDDAIVFLNLRTPKNLVR